MICDACGDCRDEEEASGAALQGLSLKYQVHADLCDGCWKKCLAALGLALPSPITDGSKIRSTSQRLVKAAK